MDTDSAKEKINQQVISNVKTLEGKIANVKNERTLMGINVNLMAGGVKKCKGLGSGWTGNNTLIEFFENSSSTLNF